MIVNTVNGNIVERIDYDEYGNILSHNIGSIWTGQPFGYAGGLYDNQTKLFRFGARDYDFCVKYKGKD